MFFLVAAFVLCARPALASDDEVTLIVDDTPSAGPPLAHAVTVAIVGATTEVAFAYGTLVVLGQQGVSFPNPALAVIATVAATASGISAGAAALLLPWLPYEQRLWPAVTAFVATGTLNGAAGALLYFIRGREYEGFLLAPLAAVTASTAAGIATAIVVDGVQSE